MAEASIARRSSAPAGRRRFTVSLSSAFSFAFLLTVGIGAPSRVEAATTIYVASSQASATAAGMVGTDASANSSGPSTFAASGPVSDSLLLVSTLQTALAAGNVTVSTANPSGTGAGKLVVVDPVTWSSARALALQADQDLEVRAGIVATGTNGTPPELGGQIALTSASGSVVVGTGLQTVPTDVRTTAGSIRIRAPNGVVKAFGGSGVSAWARIRAEGLFTGGSLLIDQAQGAAAIGGSGAGSVAGFVADGEIRLLLTGAVLSSMPAGTPAGAALHLRGGTSGGAEAAISSDGLLIDIAEGDLVVKALIGAASISSGGGAGGEQRIEVRNGRLDLLADGLSQTGAGISSGGAQTIRVHGGPITMDATGSSGQPEVGIRAGQQTGTQTIEVTGPGAGLVVRAGSRPFSFAELAANSLLLPVPQRIVVEGDVRLVAGSGVQARAVIEASRSQELTLTAGSLWLAGGPGIGAYASIETTTQGAAQTVRVLAGDATLIADDDPAATVGAARILASNGPGAIQTVEVAGLLTLVGGSPSATNDAAVIFGNSAQVVRAGRLDARGSPTQPGAGAIVRVDAFGTGSQVVEIAGDATLTGQPGGGFGQIYSQSGRQDVTIGGDLVLKAPTATFTSVRIEEIGTLTLRVGAGLDVGVNTAIVVGDGTAVVVVDDRNPTRPNRDATHRLTNAGTLDLGARGQLFAVAPFAVSLGSFVPAGTKFDHWFGEPGAIAGIHYKLPAGSLQDVPALSPSGLLFLGALLAAAALGLFRRPR